MRPRVKERRLEKHMSQTELSEKSGVSRQVINSIENNEEVNTTTKTLSAIAEALDCTIADLFTREA